MRELNIEERAFVEHHSTAGTVHEAIVKRDDLRKQLVNGEIGANRQAVMQAIANLQEFIHPPETAEQKTEKVQKVFIAQAQKFADAGD